MTDTLADKLQIWGFEGDFILFEDGSIGAGFEITPVDIEAWSDERINTYSQSIENFLNSLPSGVSIQFVHDVSYEGLGRIAEFSKGSNTSLPAGDVLRKNKADSLTSLNRDELLPRHRTYMFLRKDFSASLLSKPKLFSRKFPSLSKSILTTAISDISQLRNQLLSSLDSLGLSPRTLEQTEIADRIYSLWNPKRDISRPTYDPEDIRNHLLFSDVTVNERGFSINNVHYRVLSLKLMPETTYAAMARSLQELPFDSQCLLSISIPDQQRELESLQTQRRIAFSMARGKRSGVSDIDSEAKLTDIETLLEELVTANQKVFHVSLNIILKSGDWDLLESQVGKGLMTLREMSGAEGMAETYAAFDIFSEVALPNARPGQRSKRMKTANLADLVPLYGPWAGHAKPSVLFRSRHGTLVSFDPFSSDFGNFNQVVSGGSGSGKSFMTNLLLLQLLKENPKIFIVDIGGSYKKFCNELSGQYLPLGMDSHESINPFDLVEGESAPSSSKIKFLVGLVELMTKEDDSKSIPKYERAEIEKAIELTYQNVSRPRLSHLREILIKHSDPVIQKYGKILSTWCGATPFGRFVDAETTINLNKSIACFDLKGLETHPDLQAVALFIITDFVWRQVQKDRTTKKVLVFDECWKLLENEAGGAFIAEVFRTFRKYFAAAIAISQNMDDFAKSRVADAILSNSTTKWVLSQKGADQKRLQEVLHLNDTEMALVASLRQERRKYSEAFLMTEGHHGVVVIEPTEMEFGIASSDPRDEAFGP